MEKHGDENKGSCDQKRCQPVKVPTDDEMTALNALRRIKERVREIKKQMSDLSESALSETPLSETASDADNEQMHHLTKELDKLNREWKKWERKRDEAARERMILLGHIES